MRYFVLLLLLSTSVSICFSQDKGKISLSGEVGFPTGSNTDGIGTGFGGSLRFEQKTKNKHLNWLVSGGYLSFPLSDTQSGITVTGSGSFVPFLLGIKYYPLENFKGFYVGSDAGLTIITVKITFNYMGFPFSASNSENKFTFTPNIGYHFNKVDVAFRYNLIEDANYFGAKIGVVLN